MAKNITDLSATELAAVREHLARILNSQALIQAERLRRFLEYLVEHAISGKKGSLNQFSIACDVFDRDESFDSTVDAIVRVEAGRLRSKLLEYYDEEGRGDGVVQASLNYQWNTNINLKVGADFFYGDADGLYGQFRGNDRVSVGIEIGF